MMAWSKSSSADESSGLHQILQSELRADWCASGSWYPLPKMCTEAGPFRLGPGVANGLATLIIGTVIAHCHYESSKLHKKRTGNSGAGVEFARNGILRR